MKYFSVPADFKIETIDRFCDLNNSFDDSRVIETYGQVTSIGMVNSGRITDVLPKVDLKDFERYVGYSKSKGINFNYTLNPACMGNFEFSPEGIGEIVDLLKTLQAVGVNSLTVTSPQLIELVQGTGMDFKIKASAICEITSPSKSLFYKNKNVERIVVDPDITRDFDCLRRICNLFGSGVEIIVNNVCYKNCAYKMFHYNHEAHCTPKNSAQTIKDYFFNRCSMQKAGGVKNSIRLNWIRPEDLKYYTDVGISHFKLQGRQNVLHGDIVKALRHYFTQDYEGNLFDLITIFAPYNSFQPYIENKKLDGFVKAFYENPGFCRDMCDSCGYCEGYAQKSTDQRSVEELNGKALEFYKNYDSYTKLLDKYRQTHSKKLFSEAELDCDFDFQDKKQ